MSEKAAPYWSEEEWRIGRLIHESGRDAVAVGAVLNRPSQPQPFVEWTDLPDPARKGRLMQARWLLRRHGLIFSRRGEPHDPAGVGEGGTMAPEEARERVQAEAAESVVAPAAALQRARGETAVLLERRRCIMDVCGYCAGHHPPYDRAAKGPNSAGNWTHGPIQPESVGFAEVLCKASGIFARDHFEHAVLER